VNTTSIATAAVTCLNTTYFVRREVLTSGRQQQKLNANIIEPKETNCIRIGPRSSVDCANISTCEGRTIFWVNEVRYLGIYIVRSRYFKCTLDYAKRSFYSAVNGIFGKLVNIVSEDVILQLTGSKCIIIPLNLYGLETSY